jgi:YVTN family beta-propeller protein
MMMRICENKRFQKLMKNHYKKWIVLAAVPAVLVTAAGIGLHRWGLEHAKFMSGGQPHPANCIPCHVTPQRKGPVAALFNRTYLSPLKLAITPDGSAVLATAQESDLLLVYDLADEKVTARIPVGARPHTVVVDKAGDRAYVSNHWTNTVSVVDLRKLQVTDTLLVGSGPSGLDLTPDGRYLYVANSFTSDVSVIDLESGEEIRRLSAGNFPVGVKCSPDGRWVYVSNRRSNPVPFRTPPKTELTLIDAHTRRVAERKLLESAYIMENVTFTPSGDLALMTIIRPKNLVPSAQVEQGWMINQGFAVIETGPGGRVAQLLLDEPNSFYADPYDVVVSPDGRRAYVSHGGVDRISVVDLDAVRELMAGASEEQLRAYANDMGLSSRYVLGRIPTLHNPRGLALSPDGNRLYVAERFSDEIAVIDADRMERIAGFDLGGPKTVTMVRHGARLFYNSGGTFHGQYSCSTCHPDGHEDGLTWDLTGMGRDLENTISLLDVNNTSPFKWNGKNVSIYMQCGMRFSRFVTRTESYNTRDLNALVGYIHRELRQHPNPYQLPGGQLTEAQQRGREIFERTHDNYGREIPVRERCVTCHPVPYFTDRTRADVGTIFETDNPMPFDTPKLNNIAFSAPYLHDGRATTLEEIWTVYGEKDKHGIVNDMTKMQLNDLIEYLRSIGPAETYTRNQIKHGKL